MSETTVFEEGALVRLTRAEDRYRAGFEFTIAEYLEPRPEAEREPDEIDVPHYYGDANGGVNNVFVPADAVELVKTAAQQAARRPPTITQIRDGLSSELCGYLGYDGTEIDETVRCGADEIEGYGKTEDGLPFGFRVRVLSVWETDL